MSTKPTIVDLRSDTLTKPTPEMRQAMFEAEVGDDVWGDDPTVQELERIAAKMAGKEAAIFLPSACMGNLIAVTNHCNSRDSEVLVGDKSHIHVFEQGAVSTWGGVHARAVTNLPDGTLCLKDLRSKIRDATNVHFPCTKLICFENTHNILGGVVVPLSFGKQLREIADAANCKLHLDGARAFNACATLNVSLAELCEPFDSVSLCLSKALGAPIGSVLVGTAAFIAQARRSRKALGGGMRQVGVIAAPAIVALTKMVDRIPIDHAHAIKIGEAFAKLPFISLDLATIQSNIVIGYVKPDLEAEPYVKALLAFLADDLSDGNVSVRASAIGANAIRFVLHYDVTAAMVDMVVEKLSRVKIAF